MWRKIMGDLIAWKNDPDRKPLVLRGVRQSGKTTILRQFGEEQYDKTVYINLEKQKSYQEAFDTLETERIVSILSVMSRTPITDGDTLLILDEIQSCPQALASLKYFAEESPGIHIACAGSLLGIELARSTSKPVGKTNLMTMYPLSFQEWIVANGEAAMWEDITRDPMSMPASYSQRLEDLYRTYLFVGGMPEAVKAWVETHDEEKVKKAQEEILKWYDSDMLRYAPDNDSDKILQVWESLPRQLCTETGDFIFSHVRKGGRGRELEGALQWLVDAGLVHKVCQIDDPKVPLRKNCDISSFKVYMCDVGLMGRMMDLDLEAFVTRDMGLLSDDYRGALAESFACGELRHGFESMFYWRSGRYEVDFIIQYRSRAIPVEVKSSRRIRAESLKRYIDSYSPEVAMILSMNPPGRGGTLRMPLYLAGLATDVLDMEPFTG